MHLIEGEKRSFFDNLLTIFLRTFFQLLYHQLAWTYDWVAAIVSLGRWQQWTLSVLPHLEGPNLLEIGHGPGHLLLALNAKGIRAVGLDESWQMNHLAYDRLSKRGLNPAIINGYAQHIPFPIASFNQIVSTFPSEYIHQPRTLAEIFRVLAPGGELLVIPVAWITGRRWYERLAAWLFRFTRQSPPRYSKSMGERFSIPFQETGFYTHIEIIHFETGEVMLLHATKPGTQSLDN